MASGGPGGYEQISSFSAGYSRQFESPNARFSIQNASATERKRLIQELRVEAYRTGPSYAAAASTASGSSSLMNSSSATLRQPSLDYASHPGYYSNIAAAAAAPIPAVMLPVVQQPQSLPQSYSGRLYPTQPVYATQQYPQSVIYPGMMMAPPQAQSYYEPIRQQPEVVYAAPRTVHLYHHSPISSATLTQNLNQQPNNQNYNNNSSNSNNASGSPSAAASELADLVRSAESLRLLGQELVAYAATYSATSPQGSSFSLATSPSLPKALPKLDSDAHRSDSGVSMDMNPHIIALPNTTTNTEQASSSSAAAAVADKNTTSTPIIILPKPTNNVVNPNPQRRRLSDAFQQVRQDPAFNPATSYEPAVASSKADDDDLRADDDAEDLDTSFTEEVSNRNAALKEKFRASRNAATTTTTSASSSSSSSSDVPVAFSVDSNGTTQEARGGEDISSVNADRKSRYVTQALMMNNTPLPADESKAKIVPFGYFIQEASQLFKNSGMDDSDANLPQMKRPPPVFTKSKSKDAAASPDPSTLKTHHKEGFLLKSPSGRRWYGNGQWRRRWFTLSGRLLVYSTKKDSLSVKGMMDLATVEVETDPKKLGNTMSPHAIMVTSVLEDGIKSKRVSIKLCADTHEEILAWYKAIVTNIALLCLQAAEAPPSNATLKSTRSLPPPDRTTRSPQQEKLEKEIEKQKSKLPVPPEPDEKLFYPIYQRPPSYYDDLGVPPTATSSEIKKRFYKLARDFHPDRNRDVDPAEFARINRAYDIIQDPQTRAEYDLCERVKEVLRRGFECYRIVPEYSLEQMALNPKQREPSSFKREYVTIFCDGELNCMYFQPAPEDPTSPPLPLEPMQDRSLELRFVQYVLYGKDDRTIDTFFRAHPEDKVTDYEKETVIAITGERMNLGNMFLQVDTPEQCKELLEGLRFIRCEKSMLFKQKLDKILEQNMR